MYAIWRKIKTVQVCVADYGYIPGGGGGWGKKLIFSEEKEDGKGFLEQNIDPCLEALRAGGEGVAGR
jgi:hypothetical protein